MDESVYPCPICGKDDWYDAPGYPDQQMYACGGCGFIMSDDDQLRAERTFNARLREHPVVAAAREAYAAASTDGDARFYSIPSRAIASIGAALATLDAEGVRT